MLAVDIWCGEVKTHVAAADDPQVKHMKAIAGYDHPRAGQVKVVAPAPKLSETLAAIDRPAPMIGEHSAEILREFGFAEAEIDGLIAGGALAVAFATPPHRMPQWLARSREMP